MTQWFRFYGDAINDPKVLRMPEALRWHWVALLCVASKNDGVLPCVEDIALNLRLTEKRTGEILEDLAARGLLDEIGETLLAPHNWSGRQFKTDSSAERVGKYRDRRRAAGLPALSDYSKFKPALIERDGDRCVYCEAAVKLVVDHMVPIALGGSDDNDNLALACKPCNSGKAGRTPELAGMTIRVTSAAMSLSRYRDKTKPVTVSVTPPETEQITEQKDGADAPPISDDAGLFKRGKEVLGSDSGSLIAKLKKKKGSIALARAAIEQASTKNNPKEYIGRVINGPAQVLTPEGNAWPEGII